MSKSLFRGNIFQLDEVEYALPASEAPTLAEVLSTEDEENKNKDQKYEEATVCSALQADFLQGVSQQILQAQVCIVYKSNIVSQWFHRYLIICYLHIYIIINHHSDI